MLLQKRILELRIENRCDEFSTIFKHTNEALCKFKHQIEKDLILQDVSEDDFTQTDNDVARFQKNTIGEVRSDAGPSEDTCIIHHRESPLKIPLSTEGLVESHTFWQDNQGLNQDTTKPLPGNSFPQSPRNSPVPMSIMAQHLQTQMEANTKRAEIESQISPKGEKCAWDEEQDISKGDNSDYMNRGLFKKKQASGSRIMKFLRRMFSCGRTYVKAYDE